MTKTFRLTFLIVVTLTGIFGCKKQVKFDGIVLSRHMIPMPNVGVSIAIWHDGSSHGANPLTGTTDKDGKFNISGKVAHNDYGGEVNVHTSDSGVVEHQSLINNTTNIQVILK